MCFGVSGRAPELPSHPQSLLAALWQPSIHLETLWSSGEAREQQCAVIPLPARGAVPGTEFKTWTMPCLASWLGRKINLQPRYGGGPRFQRMLKSLEAWPKDQWCCCSSRDFHLLQTGMELGWPRTQGAWGDLHLTLGDAGCRPQPGTGSSSSPWAQVRSGLLTHPGGECLKRRKHGDTQSCSALYLNASHGNCDSFVLKHQNGSKQIFSWRLRADSPAPGEESGFLPGQQDCLVLSAATSPFQYLPDSAVSIHLDSGRIYTCRGRIAEFLCSGKGLHKSGVRETIQHWLENNCTRLWHPALPTGAVAAEICSPGTSSRGRYWRPFPKAVGDVKVFLGKTRPVSTTTTNQWDFEKV